MSLSYNGTAIQGITYNGADVQAVTMDGMEVWSAHPPFLVRMRYDANEATHVKDLVGGYTITTKPSGAVPAVADPFGGNNALDLRNIFLWYGGSKTIPVNNTTVAFWVYLPYTYSDDFVMSNADGDRGIVISEGRVGFYFGSGRYHVSGVTNNKWHYIEISIIGTYLRIFINGILSYTETIGTSGGNWKAANAIMAVGAFSTRTDLNDVNRLQGYIYDFCILNGIWHTKNYNVPTAYI